MPKCNLKIYAKTSSGFDLNELGNDLNELGYEFEDDFWEFGCFSKAFSVLIPDRFIEHEPGNIARL